MALALPGAHAAQGDSLVNRTVIPHHRGLPDDHAGSMVNEDPMAQLGAGVYLYQREKARYL